MILSWNFLWDFTDHRHFLEVFGQGLQLCFEPVGAAFTLISISEWRTFWFFCFNVSRQFLLVSTGDSKAACAQTLGLTFIHIHQSFLKWLRCCHLSHNCDPFWKCCGASFGEKRDCSSDKKGTNTKVFYKLGDRWKSVSPAWLVKALWEITHVCLGQTRENQCVLSKEYCNWVHWL